MRTKRPSYQPLCAALLLLSLVAAAPSQGQEVAASSHQGRGHWRNYGIEDGLPGLDVHAVLVDWEGFLWFGTDGSGVIRYDGNEFKTFTTRDGLGFNWVTSILQDRQGDLWLGTFGNPLPVFFLNTEPIVFEDFGKAGIALKWIGAEVWDHELASLNESECQEVTCGRKIWLNPIDAFAV